jgi:signal transduction histidine kinase
LKVTNQGEPIDPSLRSVLFEPFSRGNHPGGPGLGLGLYISRLVVAAHGGTIDVESSEDDGTSFIVTLPRSPKPAISQPSPRQDSAGSSLGNPGGAL